MRPKWSVDDATHLSSSSRFRRFFIRGSRDELYEVGEDALQTENDATNAASLDKSVHKSLSISSLFGRQRRPDGEGNDNEDVQSTRPHIRRPLATLTESPTQGEGKFNIRNRYRSRLSTSEQVGKPPVTVTTISDSQNLGETEPRKFFTNDFIYLLA